MQMSSSSTRGILNTRATTKCGCSNSLLSEQHPQDTPYFLVETLKTRRSIIILPFSAFLKCNLSEKKSVKRQSAQKVLFISWKPNFKKICEIARCTIKSRFFGIFIWPTLTDFTWSKEWVFPSRRTKNWTGWSCWFCCSKSLKCWNPCPRLGKVKCRRF